MALDRKNGIPLYIQIKNWILSRIESGLLKNGEQVPSERELATKFKVSRNTVSMAIRALELDGVVVTKQGRGAFVETGAKTSDPAVSRKDRLNFLIENLIDQALDLDFGLDQLTSFVSLKVFERRNIIKNIRVLFVDCNDEHLYQFIEEVRRESRVNVEFMLLDEFKAKGNEAFISSFDLIVTTMTHVDEIGTMADDESRVIGIATTPNLETMVKIVRLNRDEPAGIIAGTDKFVASFDRALSKAGITDFKYDSLVGRDRNMDDFLQKHEVVIVSRPLEEHVRREIRQLSMEREVIPFYYDMEKGSLDSIIAKIDMLKRGKR